MVEQDKVKVEQAKVRVEQAKVKADHAKVRANQAKARAKQTKTIMEEQAKAMAKHAKETMEERKQQTQSHVKLLETTLRVVGETRQHKHKVASEPTRQLFDELEGSTPRIFMKVVNFTTHMCKLTIR